MAKTRTQLSRDAAHIHREVCPRSPGKEGWFLLDSVKAIRPRTVGTVEFRPRKRGFQTYNRIVVATAEIRYKSTVEYVYAVSQNKLFEKVTPNNFLWEGIPIVARRLGYERADIGVTDRHAEQVILLYLEQQRPGWQLTKIAPSIDFCDKPPIRCRNPQYCMRDCRTRFPEADLISPNPSVPGALPLTNLSSFSSRRRDNQRVTH